MEELDGLRKPDPEFWRGRRVLVTGHTGFKGTWLVLWLRSMGADVTGFSLPPATKPSMFELVKLEEDCVSVLGDIRDVEALKVAVKTARPDVVFHMAAQAIVKIGLKDPALTFSTNVMGTVNLLDALLQNDVSQPSACVVVTSDKVYARSGEKDCFSEDDALGGDEPYSASKAAQEMVVSTYRHRFEKDGRNRLVTARGGNVIGGGDLHLDRLVPTILLAIEQQKPVCLKMPEATRPWQHVLDCLCGYMLYAESVSKYEDIPYSLNFGPKGRGIQVQEVAENLYNKFGEVLRIEKDNNDCTAEHVHLSINSSLAETKLGWTPIMPNEIMWTSTADWHSSISCDEENIKQVCICDIGEYCIADYRELNEFMSEYSESCKMLTDIKKGMLRVKDYCKETLKQGANMTLLDDIVKYIDGIIQYQSANGAKNLCKNKWLDQPDNQFSTLVAYEKAWRVLYTHHWLPIRLKDKKYCDILRSGKLPKDIRYDEKSNDFSNASNLLNEYYFASTLAQLGTEVEHIHEPYDVKALLNGDIIYVECKQISREKQLKPRCKEAIQKLSVCNGIRIAFFDLSNIVYEEIFASKLWDDSSIQQYCKDKLCQLHEQIKKIEMIHKIDIVVIETFLPYAQDIHGPSTIVYRIANYHRKYDPKIRYLTKRLLALKPVFG